jgi:Fe-S oxidoreductase
VLQSANVKFETLRDEGCCGAILILTGFTDEAGRNARSVIERISECNFETLVTGCAGCFRAFSKLYPESLGLKTPFKALHTSQLFEKLLSEGRLKFRELRMRVAYHDPCELGRHCGVYEEPRKVLEAIPGLKLVEMKLNREKSTCCGGGGGAWALYSDVCMEVAKEKIVDEVLPLDVDVLTSCCPMCYMNFYYNVERHSMPLKVLDFSQVVELALRGR